MPAVASAALQLLVAVLLLPVQLGAAPQQPPFDKPALHDAPVHERQLPD